MNPNEPENPEKTVREHVKTLQLVGEQLSQVENWMWQHLAGVRAATPAGPTPRRAVALATPCLHCTHPYNWHASRGGCEITTCGCARFGAGERPDPVDPRSILGVEAPAEHCEHDGIHPGFTCGEADQTLLFWEAQWARNSGVSEEEQRAARRVSLRKLLTSVNKGALTTEECALLWQHVDTEMREHDTMRAVAAGNKRHVQTMYADLVQAQKEHGESDEAARRALEQRQEMAEERFVIQGQRDRADRLRAEVQRDRDQHAAVLAEVLGRFRQVDNEGVTYEGEVIGFVGPTVAPDQFAQWCTTVASTVEQPWWEQLAELRAGRDRIREEYETLLGRWRPAQAAVERVRQMADGWEQRLPETILTATAVEAIRAALDGTEQDTAEAVESLHAKLDEATATLRRVLTVTKTWAPRLLPHSEAHRMCIDVRDALAGPAETENSTT